MTQFQDKTIECIDCHKEFLFEAGEQAFYAERGYVQPKRCKPCRNKRKAQKAEQADERDQ